LTIHTQIDDEEQRQLIEEYSKFLNPTNTLEVGTGYGRMSQYFSDYIGLDKNKKHIIKSTGDRILAIGDYLPFPDRSFDLIFTCTALMLNKNGETIINEIIRCSNRFVLFIELKKDTKWAYRHQYEILEKEGFEL